MYKMFLLQAIFNFTLILCETIGIVFMIASTILVIVSIVRGDISVHFIKGEKEKEK